MSKKPATVKQQFAASNGKSFSTKAEAEAEQRFIDARKAFDEARRALVGAMARRCKTADGKPFEFPEYYREFWYLEGIEWPRLQSVVLNWWTPYEFLECGEIIVSPQDGDRLGGKRNFMASDLYTSKAAAQKAMIQRMEQTHAEHSEYLIKLKGGF